MTEPRPRLVPRLLCAVTGAWLLLSLPVLAAGPAPVLVAEHCSVEGLLDSLRGSGAAGSAAYRRYLRTLVREAAVSLPDAALREAFARETDPLLAEHLAAALVARTERGADPTAMQAVTRRALEDVDPALRAASVRALRRTSALERTGDLYERLVRDASPEVRMEAATNLAEDNAFVYAGQHGPSAEAAIKAAAASTDPKVTAEILGELGTGAVGPEAAEQLYPLLGSRDAQVRRAAVNALAGLPARHAATTREALVAMYRGEPDLEVRKALLQGVARLGFAGAVPELQRLRAVHPELAPEVDAWLRALGLGLQEWTLILREKQRLQ